MDRPERSNPPLSLVYGFHSVREALRHRPQQIARVLVSASRTGARREEIVELCARHRIELQEVAEPVLRARAGNAHNGFAAELSSQVEASSADSGRDPRLVVLFEDVQDPRNLGAALRVCEGVGVGRVLIRDRGSAPMTPTVAKTSAGASEWLDCERIGNSAVEIERLKEQGFWVYGTVVEGVPPWTLDLSGPVVLCFGGEENGLRSRTRSLCDHMIGLPMRGHVGSLNLSTAVSAVLYEALRQRSPQ
jgi:23S rRNA (guanosine2251-2'-O)-methyltransferase